MTKKNWNRREFIVSSALTASAVTVPRFAWARAPGEGRLVVIILRGALDGLAAVPPYGDPHYANARGVLALDKPGTTGGVLRLDATFGLHPALGFLHECYHAQQLTVVHAVSTAYRERSHFDGQDVLENGLRRPHEINSGWLNRALDSLSGAATRDAGIALGNNVPLMMRGPARVAAWSPSRLSDVDDDTLQRLADLYADDPVLSRRLADALANDAIATDASADRERVGKREQLAATLQAAAKFLVRREGPRVAVLETRGWDTHANQGADSGQLAQRLRVLDAALREFRFALQEVWEHTAVLLVTEFGRTVAVNGTRGTDHGTGAAAFLAGGAVRGGRTIADWPGLGPKALYQGRDLTPTLDLRAVLKGVLAEQLGVSANVLEREVFTDSRPVAPLRDLIRV
ncbi:MAG: DUF1501 domain-containing protein [Pseudomonadales bacterium]|nr:DUF1501 domain-containing protein [Pseudomonadales bacterium]